MDVERIGVANLDEAASLARLGTNARISGTDVPSSRIERIRGFSSGQSAVDRKIKGSTRLCAWPLKIKVELILIKYIVL